MHCWIRSKVATWISIDVTHNKSKISAMPRATSSNAKPQARTFEFETSRADEFGTLGELMTSLEAELEKPNGEPITSKSLKRTTDFLRSSIGLSIDSKQMPLPLLALKTARLVFLADLKSKRNVIRMLSPPQSTGEATMEFSTVTTTPRDREAAEIIERLAATLALEIDPSRVSMFSRLIGEAENQSVTEKLLLHAERTNDAVTHILSDGLSGTQCSLAASYEHMANQLNMLCIQRSDERRAPANEALYCYLQTLSFRHFITHYPRHLQETLIKSEIGDIRSEAERFCRIVTGDAQWHHGPDDQVFSVNTSHCLLDEWPEEVSHLVHSATGIPTTSRQLRPHATRCKAILASYAYRSFDCADSNAPILSVYDVIAALASSRYQQEEGEDYKPYWPGQTDQGKSPQRLFDKGLDPDDPHQHQGVHQIYLNRFYEYQASFNGTANSNHAWMRYQMALHRAYQAILELQDIVAITMGLTALNFYCVNQANDFVRAGLIRNSA